MEVKIHFTSLALTLILPSVSIRLASSLEEKLKGKKQEITALIDTVYEELYKYADCIDL
jgi:hypothetical protein